MQLILTRMDNVSEENVFERTLPFFTNKTIVQLDKYQLVPDSVVREDSTTFLFYGLNTKNMITSMFKFDPITDTVSCLKKETGIWKFESLSNDRDINIFKNIEYILLETPEDNTNVFVTPQRMIPGERSTIDINTIYLPELVPVMKNNKIIKITLGDPIQTHTWSNGKFVPMTPPNTQWGAAARPRVKKTATSATWVPSKPRRTVRIADGSVRVLYSNPRYPGQHRIRKGRRGGDGRITYSYVKAPTSKRA